ncbi:hypothetical protein [Actinophytocola oryzae]|uniref:Uncharacterized protein n=1 Tax=Actinophytocola oryzae TaxID=502181 RepID=A0A4R7URA6_9PSEU|nr:hypothetical protein [Actinophytocola oryzae]TDV37592.1 hypothetical protein CLV71_12955 [Actinophytocola oryzae]
MYIPTVVLRAGDASAREAEARLGELAASWSRLIRRRPRNHRANQTLINANADGHLGQPPPDPGGTPPRQSTGRG